MNVEELEKRLIAAARALTPGESVPYAFEKRVMAALAARPAIDVWAIWSQLLWRAAAPCVAIMLLTSLWSFTSASSANSPTSLAADLERTVWGPLSSINDSW